ncbi:transmembrane protein 101-like isoform X3 [Onychostruthus taczanowskii]|uniref:transmembrane protein 101-like isoform X3 n=1 Tax=Onychostruthus taczanowskii TaxID=356909 RepID=UPI001B80CDE4|nr:transmembrane protein 101-like isoform X3 [Onychostruthus taczanowskii]
MAAGRGWRRRALRLLTAGGGVLLTRFPFWHCFSGLLLCAERADLRRKPDIPVPYLYVDMGVAVLCASFMSFGVKRRWFALGAALQLAVATYAAHVGGHVHYGDWLKAYSLQHSTEDRLAYLDHLLGGELALQLLFLLYGLLALAFLSGYYVRTAAQVLAVLLPLAILLIDGNLGYWHALRRVEFWNQMKLIGQNVGIFGAVVILATDG